MPRRRYSFGPFELDTATRVLYRCGQRVPLSPKAADLLTILVEKAGALVEKGELLRLVWPETFVEEGNLAKTISLLRRDLAANQRGEPYIETVPKRGYRFVAHVEQAPERHDQIIEFEEHTVERISIQETRVPSRLKSVAVLPFKALHPEPIDTDLALGLFFADALISRIATLRGMLVLSTSAVWRCGDPKLNPISVARELGVSAAVDGYFQRSGDNVLVSVQLLRTEDGKHLWTGRFQEQLGNGFTAQESIAEQVARALRPELATALTSAAQHPHVMDMRAYEAYARGRLHLLRYSPRDTLRAIEAFEEVTTAWPEFPPAHIGLTLSHLQSPIFQLSTNKAAWYVAQREARRALALDSRLPEALGALGAVEFLYGWDWHAAESHLERAVGAQPACPELYIYYGDFLDAVGRADEALAIKRRALQIDPMSTMVHLRIASSYVFLRRYKEAIEWTRKALALDPNNVTAQYRLAATCYMTGEYDEWARLAISLAGYLGHPAEAASEMKEEYRRNGRASLVRQLLPRGERCTPAYTVWAKCYLECGDKEQALVCLERAFEERDRGLVHLNVDPSWDGLRGEERFADLLRRMDLA